MQKHLLVLSIAATLGACGSDSDSSSNKDTQPVATARYVAQLYAQDYSSSQVASGAINGDRSATQGLLVQAKSDYSLSTYGNALYQLGRYQIDTVSRYQGTDLNTQIWQYSTRQANENSSNTYQLVQYSDTVAYLIRYDSPLILKVNPTASSAEQFVVASIDLSAYIAEGADTPKMNSALIAGDRLFVSMQRLDANWQAQTAYVAVIDLASGEEIDTDPQTDGLAGIALEGINPAAMVLHNGRILITNRGDYANNSGTLEAIDTTTFARTTLADGDSFPQYHRNLDDDDTSNDVIYHFQDVAIASDQRAYLLLSQEKGAISIEGQLLPFDPSTATFADSISSTLPALDGQPLGDINVGPESRLWVSIKNLQAPSIAVIDSDTHTLNGELIELDMPASQIEFLSE